MNEITKIHLGRQPFIVAVDAYKALQAYLHEIKRQVGKNGEGVLEEVEMRMAELLAERGISGDKVVLLEDVTYLKDQLGAPRDFKDEEEGVDTKANDTEPEAEPVRRLFRDTQHGMLAGVSAGLGNYFGIDAVVFRLLFVVATLAGGWGIPIYLIMWLIVPEAKTASDRLQMRGKAVTVDSIKEAVDRTVERADVPGAAHRASNVLARIVETLAQVLLGIIGAAFCVGATVMLVGLSMVAVYTLLHSGHMIHGVVQFPVGPTEVVAAIAGMAVLASIAGFLLSVGIAMIRRKWSLPGWGVAAIAGIFLAGLVAGGAAAPDTVNNVRSRYEASRHTETRSVAVFDSIRVLPGDAEMSYRYEWGDTYSVELHYLGRVATKDIKTTVDKQLLTVDSRDFKPGSDWQCDGLCVSQADFMEVIVRAPIQYEEMKETSDKPIILPGYYREDLVKRAL